MKRKRTNKHSTFYGEYTHKKTNDKTSMHLTGDVPMTSIFYYDSVTALEDGRWQSDLSESKWERVQKLKEKYGKFASIKI